MLVKRLKELRIEQGLTQKELAKKAGLSTVQVSQLEQGAKRITQPSFDAVLDALGVTVDEYFSHYSSKDMLALKKAIRVLKSDDLLVKNYFQLMLECLITLMDQKGSRKNECLKTLTVLTEHLIDRRDHFPK